jgi:hypothetical protein
MIRIKDTILIRVIRAIRGQNLCTQRKTWPIVAKRKRLQLGNSLSSRREPTSFCDHRYGTEHRSNRLPARKSGQVSSDAANRIVAPTTIPMVLLRIASVVSTSFSDLLNGLVVDSRLDAEGSCGIGLGLLKCARHIIQIVCDDHDLAVRDSYEFTGVN